LREAVNAVQSPDSPEMKRVEACLQCLNAVIKNGDLTPEITSELEFTWLLCKRPIMKESANLSKLTETVFSKFRGPVTDPADVRLSWLRKYPEIEQLQLPIVLSVLDPNSKVSEQDRAYAIQSVCQLTASENAATREKAVKLLLGLNLSPSEIDIVRSN